MEYRQFPVSYALKYSITKAPRRYNRMRSTIFSTVKVRAWPAGPSAHISTQMGIPGLS